MNLTIDTYADTYRSDILSLWAEALPLDAVTEEIFESRVLLDENFDPQTLLVARSGRDTVGFIIGTYAKRLPLGDADPDGTKCWITILAVSPNVSLREVGGALLADLERRFRALGKKECSVANYPPGYFTPGIDKNANAELLAFLQESGYKPFHEALSMDAPIVLFTVPDKVKAKEAELKKEGILVRRYERADLVKFLAFLERSMPTDWVRVERRNLRKMAEGIGFHPGNITIVSKGDEIIGYCQFEGAHFGPFGVADAFQGKGIGTVLLARTLERMRMEGHHIAWVMWTDDIAAKVYGKFGFTQTRRFVLLKKAL